MVNVTTRLTFTAVFETVEDGWVQAHLREIPGVITVAPTRKQAQDDLLDALAEYLSSLGERPEHGRLVAVEDAADDELPLEVVIRAS